MKTLNLLFVAVAMVFALPAFAEGKHSCSCHDKKAGAKSCSGKEASCEKCGEGCKSHCDKKEKCCGTETQNKS